MTRRADRKAAFVAFRNLMTLMLCVCLGCGTNAEAREACRTIEVSAVANGPTDSTRAAVDKDTTKTAVSARSLLTNTDITGANAFMMPAGWVLKVDMTKQAAKRIQEFTSRHLGEALAFTVDGKIQITPRIGDTLRGRGIFIGGFKEADAEFLAAAMNNGCRR